MMGGARLLVKADGGLNDQAGANSLSYEATQISGEPLFLGPFLSRKFHGASNPLFCVQAMTSSTRILKRANWPLPLPHRWNC